MFTREVICIRIQSRMTLNMVILTSILIFPINTIFMKFISDDLIPTSITALDMKGNIPCKRVTTSIMKNIVAKLFLYGMK